MKLALGKSQLVTPRIVLLGLSIISLVICALAGVAHYQQAVALFRDLGDLQGLSSSLAVLSLRGASYP